MNRRNVFAVAVAPILGLTRKSVANVDSLHGECELASRMIDQLVYAFARKIHDEGCPIIEHIEAYADANMIQSGCFCIKAICETQGGKKYGLSIDSRPPTPLPTEEISRVSKLMALICTKRLREIMGSRVKLASCADGDLPWDA
jgi:hypothetical protein